MNKFLKFLFLILSFCLILAYFFKLENAVKISQIDLQNLQSIDDLEQYKNILKNTAEKLCFVKSLYAPNILISINRIKVRGDLYYEGNKLRLIVKSFLGDELDLGSNDNIFWFWSKRMRPQALYYSEHKDSEHTNLRPIFNKDWLLDCFVFGRIKDNEVNVLFFKKDNLLIKKQFKGELHEQVCILTVIDLEKSNIVKKFMCDSYGCVLASVEYSEFDANNIPRFVRVFWNEEGITMDWCIREVKINTFIKESTWKIPSYEPLINMSSR